MTDSELKKAFSKGFANPQHLTDLLKRADLPQDRLMAARANLAQAVNSGHLTKEALQRFISQLSKAKSLNQFDQVLAELRHVGSLIESGVVAQNSLVFVSAKKGRQYDLGSTTIKIDPVHEADILYLGTDGQIHLHEVKNTATALRNKLQKKRKQLDNMLDWREKELDKREIRMVIGTEVGWTEVLATRRREAAALVMLIDNDVPLTIGEFNLTLAQMNELSDAIERKTTVLKKQRAWSGFNDFYRQMPTLLDAEHLCGTQACRRSFLIMKTMTLPKKRLNLPPPWGKTHPKRRREALGSLSYETDSIKTALNVLERCLHTLSEFTLSEDDCIPEELYELWTFSANSLAVRIPTFDDFDLKKVEQFLINDEGIDSPSPDMIRDVGEYWLWWVTWEIERAVLRWVQHALMKTREPLLISDFLYIAERYWLLVEPDLASSLLSRSAMIGWQKALPLFESVEQNPKASALVIETVRDYRDLILDNPHKWLPESDAFSELLTNDSDHLPQPTTQPALAELAYL